MTLASAVGNLLVLSLIAAGYGTVWWIYRDAQANVDAGTPVTLAVGNFRIETPKAWAIGSLLFF